MTRDQLNNSERGITELYAQRINSQYFQQTDAAAFGLWKAAAIRARGNK